MNMLLCLALSRFHKLQKCYVFFSSHDRTDWKATTTMLLVSFGPVSQKSFIALYLHRS